MGEANAAWALVVAWALGVASLALFLASLSGDGDGFLGSGVMTSTDWAWIVAGLFVIGIIGVLMLRDREAPETQASTHGSGRA